LRAELAKEEYATTWQEEEQGEPQTRRLAQPEDDGGAQREALDARAYRRVTQNQRTKERGSKGCGSKGSGQTQHQAQRAEPEVFGHPPPRSGNDGSGE
jgi:hypothetical protein